MKIETGFGVEIEINEQEEKVTVRNNLLGGEVVATEDCLQFKNKSNKEMFL